MEKYYVHTGTGSTYKKVSLNIITYFSVNLLDCFENLVFSSLLTIICSFFYNICGICCINPGNAKPLLHQISEEEVFFNY